MAMGFAQLNTHEVELPVAYTALRDDGFGKLPYLAHRALEHHGLNALLMIEVRMHGRNRHVMVIVLKARQTLR